MKNRIPFDISHKEEIINGKYTVETRDGQRVEIVLWNWDWPFPILGKVGQDGDPHIWTSSGTVGLTGLTEEDLDLFIVTEEAFTKFEEKLFAAKEKLKQNSEYYRIYTEGVEEFKEVAKELLNAAKEELCEEDFKKSETPVWKKFGKDAVAGCSDSMNDLYLIRTAPGFYFTSKVLSPNCEYLVLEDLEKLPKEF